MISPVLTTTEQAALEQLKQEIRATTRAKRGARQPCYICNGHVLVSELHHLIPVPRLARYLLDTGAETYPMLNVWLCPNCHAYWHRLECASKRERIAIFGVMKEDERARYLELMQRKVEALARMYGVELPEDA